jgi:hypothetical protein
MIDRIFPPLADDSSTTLLLAGDTGSYRRRTLYAAVISHLCARFLQVFDVPGNHYWYGGTDWNLCEKPVVRPSYHFGHMLSVGPVVACTLWADFQGGNPLVEEQCVQGMNDFRQVPGLTPLMVKQRHAEQVEFLRRTIKPGDVVMTHFAPSWQSVHDRYRNDPCNGYYASDIEDVIISTRPSLWVHGHIHDRSAYTIGATQVICNPVGYGGRGHDPYLRMMSTGGPVIYVQGSEGRLA